MWLKRVQGGEREVFLGRETVLGEAFEVDVPADEAKALQQDERFAKPTAAQVKAAKVKAAKTAEAKEAAEAEAVEEEQ